MEETDNASLYSDGEDRISRLTDELIHCIMSFIDTKYAVQTCVLSKRWIHVWKSLPYLNFYRKSFSEDKKHSFIMFVDMVFISRSKDIDVQKLSVDWADSGFDNTVTLNVNRWSLHAIEYNVQEVNIVIDQLHNSAYEVPHRLFNCKSLRKLEIQVFASVGYVDIILPRSVNLPQLTELTIYGLSISNLELSKELFSSCPVLDTLSTVGSVVQTDNLRNLIVDSPSLTSLAYLCSHRHLLPQNDTMANVIKLCAPNLEHFSFSFLLTQDYSLQIFSPLASAIFFVKLDAKIKVEDAETYEELPWMEKDVYARRVVKYLGAVSMVEDLGLSAGFLEVLSRAPDLLDCQPPHLTNLQDLTLEIWSTRDCLRGVAYLFSISPNITKILIDSKKSDLEDIGNDWEAGFSSPEMLSHLKFVEVVEAKGCDAELKLVSLLLKNAKVLEKVALFIDSSLGSPDNDRVRQIKRFKKKLRAVPTASSRVQMVFS